MEEIRVGSWGELQEALFADAWQPQIERFRSTFAYRGRNDAAEDLRTSLLRLGGDRASVERHLLRNFRKYAPQAHVPLDSIWNWLALAQHHGLPTRLLLGRALALARTLLRSRQMKSAGALPVWAAFGAAAAFATLEVGSFGLALAAILFLVLPGWRQAGAMFAGAAALPLWIAYANREGPGMTCHPITNGVECGEQLNPWPWLAAGLMLGAVALLSCIAGRRRG